MTFRDQPGRLALLAGAIALAFPLLATAQTASPAPAADAPVIETVVIRARGRDETQQSVPLSVKAFSSKAIEDAGIRTPDDFVALTPNLSLAESQSVGTSFMTIRGLAQVRNGEAPMAVVVDGVIQSDAKQFTQELFDVQTIEVLRGPQGALYGRNASGGAILIRTKQPGNQTSGFARVSFGTGSEKTVQGAVGGALIDNQLYFRLSGNYTDRAGYFDNLTLGRKADAYTDKTVRGLLKWQVSDALALDLRASLVRDKAGGGNFQYQPTHLLADCTADPANAFDFSRLNPNAVSRTFCANNFGTNTRDMDELTLKADYDLGFATLTGIASHNKVQEYLAADQFPYTATRNLFGAFDGTQTQWVDVSSDSLELRLTSANSKGLRWMAGVYGLTTKRFISTTTGSDLGKGVDTITTDPRFASSTNPTLSWFADRNRNQASAVFGNVDVDLSPRIEASLARAMTATSAGKRWMLASRSVCPPAAAPPTQRPATRTPPSAPGSPSSRCAARPRTARWPMSRWAGASARASSTRVAWARRRPAPPRRCWACATRSTPRSPTPSSSVTRPSCWAASCASTPRCSIPLSKTRPTSCSSARWAHRCWWASTRLN